MIDSSSVGKLHSNCFTPGEALGPAACLWRWRYQNPPGDKLKTPGIQSVGCLVTPDTGLIRGGHVCPMSYLGVIEEVFRLRITQANGNFCIFFLSAAVFFPQGEIRVHA